MFSGSFEDAKSAFVRLIAVTSSYAIAACQALQRCSANVVSVPAVRRIWRRAAESRRIQATRVRGHSGDQWNRLADALATAHDSIAVP